MIQKIDFQSIAQVSVGRIHDVISSWLPGGRVQGNEYVVRNPRRSDSRVGSFKVNVQTGAWSDFATNDAGGDLISLIAYLENISQSDAAHKLAEFAGIPFQRVPGVPRVPGSGNVHAKPVSSVHMPGTPPPSEGVPGVPGAEFEFVAAVPPDAPEELQKHFRHGSPSAVWRYRTANGSTYCLVFRFDTAEGKQFSPQSLWQKDNAFKWMWKGPAGKRLPYNLNSLVADSSRPVMVTEGEKAADAVNTLMPEFVATTSMNGAQSPHKTDWSYLKGRDVWIFPDNDEPGSKYAKRVYSLIQDAGANVVSVVDLRKLREFCAEKIQYQLKESDDAADLVCAGLTAEYMREFMQTLVEAAKTKSGAASRFLVNDTGVYFLNDTDDPPMLICSPLYVEAAVCDEHSESWGRLLSFRDQAGKSHVWSMPMEMLRGSGEEYRGHLLSLGLNIEPGRKAHDRLTSYIQTAAPKRTAMCSNRTGWHGNSFVLPKQTIRAANDAEIIYQSADIFQHGLVSRGTSDEWREVVSSKCAGNSRLVFAVSVGLAAPLLNLIRGESGGFHFRGASSVGKTTALQVACSLYGGSEYLLQWRATDNGLEAVAAAHSDLMLALDEIGQMDATKVGETAYMLANGRGKSRANRSGGAKQPFTWRLLFVSTGEIGLCDAVRAVGRKAMAGHEVRIVDVPADAGAGFGIFEDLHGFADGDAFARYLKDACQNSYGTAALDFIKTLVQDVETAQAQVRHFQSEFMATIAVDKANGQVKRVAGRFALVAASGELATNYGITGWERGEATAAAAACFQAWLDSKGDGKTFEAQSILSQVRLFFEQHGDSRFALMTACPDGTHQIQDSHRVIQNRAGFRKRTDDGTEFYVMPEVFGQEICKGMDRTTAARTLIAEGWLVSDGEGKSSVRHRLPDVGRARVYQFTSKVLSSSS